MEPRDFVSASGLRPLSAFVVIAVVLAAVAGRVALIAMESEPLPERSELTERGCDLGYSIREAGGRVLATFVERYELHASPRALWQGHTPDHMAARIAEVVGVEAPTLLERLLPDAREGWIEVEGWQLDERHAGRVLAWIRSADLPGIQLAAPSSPAGTRRLRWCPAQLLSRETRERVGRGRGPWSWTRTLADSLATCLWGPLEVDDPQLARELRDERRDAIWQELMPCTWSPILFEVPSAGLCELRQVLAEEGVQRHQLWFERDRERIQPGGGFDLLGTWGWIDTEPGQPVARGGLERLCDRYLDDPRWSEVLAAPTSYRFRTDHTVRRRARPYYGDSSERQEAPAIQLSLDLELQQFVRGALEALLETHGAALAEAIVLEVASGRVLAVDAVSRYGSGSFAPIHHTFTPGSTFKVITMTTALDLGLVRPHEEIDVGRGGAWRIPGSSRVIHEAEGHLSGVVAARDCLAWSMNSGMTQIGLRIDDLEFHQRLLRLGYGTSPGTGFGNDEAGYLPDARVAPWKEAWTHASICFGHELTTTLWQHAAALATVVRGGDYRALSLVAGIEAGGRFHPAPLPPARPVYRPETCAQVRDMLEFGAREGTGRRVWRAGLGMGTKTGTAQKTSTEVSMHVLGPALQAASQAGRHFSRDDYAALPLRGPVQNCYTSSMCMYASSPLGGEELMVLVVVEEPTGKEKFGSKVAGPTTLSIMERALGLDGQGLGDAGPGAAQLAGFGLAAESALANLDPLPWAEGGR